MIILWIVGVIAGWSALSIITLLGMHMRITWLEDTGRMPRGQRRWFDDPSAVNFFAFAWPLIILFMVVVGFAHLWWCITPHPAGRRAERARARAQEQARVKLASEPPQLRVIK